MKTKPLMICENCGHKASEHDEHRCQHNDKLMFAAVALAAHYFDGYCEV